MDIEVYKIGQRVSKQGYSRQETIVLGVIKNFNNVLEREYLIGITSKGLTAYKIAKYEEVKIHSDKYFISSELTFNNWEFIHISRVDDYELNSCGKELMLMSLNHLYA